MEGAGNSDVAGEDAVMKAIERRLVLVPARSSATGSSYWIQMWCSFRTNGESISQWEGLRNGIREVKTHLGGTPGQLM